MTDTFWAGPESEIRVGRHILDDVLPPRPSRIVTAVLTQPGQARQVADRIAAGLDGASVLEVPDRDAAKDLAVVGSIYDWLFDVNLGRSDTIVGVGGGALTDLAGFVAATWVRGVESVLVPTTLLGAVDASIGGKTGINRRGKNLVGAFWHPRRVVVDLDILDALPADLKREGSAEIIKAGYIADPDIIEEYRQFGPDARLQEVVPRAIAVKSSIVAADFRESGDRALLNLGHTIGHAVEMLAPMPHGPAVAVGLVAAAAISEQRYGFDRSSLVEVVQGAGLPVSAPGLDRQECLRLISRDKKRAGQAVRMVLLEAPGKPVLENVTGEEIDLALSAVQVGS